MTQRRDIEKMLKRIGNNRITDDWLSQFQTDNLEEMLLKILVSKEPNCPLCSEVLNEAYLKDLDSLLMQQSSDAVDGKVHFLCSACEIERRRHGFV